MYNKLACSVILCMGLAFASSIEGTLYQDPNCGCCGDWKNYMQQEGFKLKVIKDSKMNEIKKKNNIQQQYVSCHTAIIDNYVIEGHVPPQEVRRLLQEKPQNVIGISVPKMPIGSYGMDYSSEKQQYDVLLLLKDGTSTVYSTYDGKEKIAR